MNFNLLTISPEDGQTSKTLDVGNHEWPFEAQLPGDAPETVAGLQPSWIGYRVIATVHTGKISKDRVFIKPVRVMRTILRGSLGALPVESVRAFGPVQLA